MRSPDNLQFNDAYQPPIEPAEGLQAPVDPTEAMPEAMTVEARMAAIADRLKPEQQEQLYRAVATYGEAIDKVGQVSVQEMHKQAGKAPEGYEAYAANRQLRGKLAESFTSLDRSDATDRAVEAVAESYGVNAQPQDQFAKIRQDDAKRRLSRGATEYFREYKETKSEQAVKRLGEKAEEIAPGAPTEEDEEIAASLGAEDLDDRLHARLDAIETALNTVVPRTAGRAILRKLSVAKDWESQSAEFDVTKAVHDLEYEITTAGRSPWTTEQTRTAINTYMKVSGLQPPGKEEYAVLIDEVVSELGPTVTADEANAFIKNKLESTTVPELKMFGLIKDPNEKSSNANAGAFRRERLKTPFDDLIDDLLSGKFGTKDQKSNYHFGGQGAGNGSGYDRSQAQTPRGREQSEEEQDVMSEIDRLRAEGVPDNKIKQRLLKKYRDPTGQNDDPRAKVVSDKFRPKNSNRHYGG